MTVLNTLNSTLGSAGHVVDSPPFAIGDLQGCGDALRRLLAAIDAAAPTASALNGSSPSPNAVESVSGAARHAGPPPLWFVGDLVNRGPTSLATLRQVIALGSRALALLGNHDLHLLAVAAGVRELKRGDTIGDILQAPDAADLLDWVRRRPLAHFENGMLLVHAGVLPQWDVALTLELAAEIEFGLRGPDWRTFIAKLFGNEPARWQPGLAAAERLRVATNALTRLRLCSADGTMDFKSNGAPAGAPAGFMPWFDVPSRRTAEVTVVFGHWAALGLTLRENLCAIDSGCVWGNALTAVQLNPDPKRRTVMQVDCSAQR